jgi:hypothetical protein
MRSNKPTVSRESLLPVSNLERKASHLTLSVEREELYFRKFNILVTNLKVTNNIGGAATKREIQQDGVVSRISATIAEVENQQVLHILSVHL